MTEQNGELRNNLHVSPTATTVGVDRKLAIEQRRKPLTPVLVIGCSTPFKLDPRESNKSHRIK